MSETGNVKPGRTGATKLYQSGFNGAAAGVQPAARTSRIDGKSRRRRRVRALGALLTLALVLTASPWLVGVIAGQIGVAALARAHMQDEPGAEAARAVSALELAYSLHSGDSGLAGRLAEAYILAGYSDHAVQLLEHSYRLQPDSLLRLEALADAYEAAGRAEEAMAIWQTLGITGPAMLEAGNGAFTGGRYSGAVAWYRRALAQGVAGDEPAFMAAVAGVLAGRATTLDDLRSQGLAAAATQITLVQGTGIIPGGGFRSLEAIPGTPYTFGTPLSYYTQDGTGLFPWNGEAAVVVSLGRAGLYRLEFRLRESFPPPVIMAVAIDGRHQQDVTLTGGDNDWATVVVEAPLAAGLHTIHLRFLNNAILDGHDRDASVESLIVRSLP